MEPFILFLTFSVAFFPAVIVSVFLFKAGFFAAEATLPPPENCATTRLNANAALKIFLDFFIQKPPHGFFFMEITHTYSDCLLVFTITSCFFLEKLCTYT